MTVKELRPILTGPEDKFEVQVAWEGDEYNITDAKSPVLATFADYEVEDLTCPQPFQYTIFLRREYVRREATA